ncbi:hypothetical protein Q9314_28705 (plasmid) [Shinella sumterensis]|nr:hypothetical protein Q9314_28705 [Shinella sumterensis]
MKDTDGDYCHAEFLKLAQQLIAEGRDRARVEHALLTVGRALATERNGYMMWLFHTRDYADSLLTKIAAMVEKMEAEQRNASH